MSRQLNKIALEYKYCFNKYYNVAKKINLIIVLVSFVISIISVISIKCELKLESIIMFSTFIWVLISICLKSKINKNKKNGADFQELFDTYIFKIAKNERIMYPKRNSSYRISNFAKIIKDKYYDIDENIINNKIIIYTQRDNIIYDKQMRKRYYNENCSLAIIYIIIIVILAIIMDLKIFNLVINLVMPSINIFNYIIGNIINLKIELKQIENAEVNINFVIDKLHIENEKKLSTIIRQFQDFIYLKRRNWIMIPNYLYKIDNVLKMNSYEIYNNEIKNDQNTLKKQALELEKKLGIIDYLKQYGRAEIVGGVANKLIVNKDIDIHLLTKNNLVQISQKLVIYLQLINYLSNIKVEDFQFSKASICVTIKDYNGWQIEVWMSNKKEFVGFHLRDQIKKSLDLDDNKRKNIMDLKTYYYHKGLLFGQMSTIIYKAVIFKGITNLNQFKRYIIKNNII